MADCAVPVQSAISISSWDVGLVCRGWCSKCPANAPVVLWVRQCNSRRIVVLRVVCLLRRLIPVVAPITANSGRHRSLAHGRGRGAVADEQLIVPVGKAVAPHWIGVPVTSSSSVRLFAVVALIRVLVGLLCALLRVRYGGVVVVLAVALIVRHGCSCSPKGPRRRAV